MTLRSKLVVLDRDGVINFDADDYIKSAEEWRPIPGSLDAIARLVDAGIDVAVVSNQSGLGRGLFDQAALDAINEKMNAGIAAAGGRLAGVYYCPHAPDVGCSCRKPEPGLLDHVARDLGVETFAGVPIVGDKASDLALARAVGGRAILVRSGKGMTTAATLDDEDVEIYDDLAGVVDALLGGRHHG
jgi:D-glycero-D-manno-heptose 1,7-bisphosphate phosphatase